MSIRRRILTGRPPTRTRKTQKNKKLTTSPIVSTFLHMLTTVKLFHWKNTDYATHKATDELYSELNDKIDTFVEVMLGKLEVGSRAKLLNISLLKLDVASHNNAFKKQIEEYKRFLIAFKEPALGTDLLAIRDELLAAFNKCLYLMGGAPPDPPIAGGWW